jgi:predicted cupin superfamily sugar epimerase
MMPVAHELVTRLDLQPHPEGGWFRETYRSPATVATPFGDRPAGTSILYLLDHHHVSRLHRLRQDEVWSFHAGAPLRLHTLGDGGHREHRLGSDHALQDTVPAGAWMGAEPVGGWSLVGCACMPGFHFDDLEFADGRRLAAAWPDQAGLIGRLCP